MDEAEEKGRVEAVQKTVYEAVVTRGKEGATIKDLEEERIQVVWPGSRVQASQKMIKTALDWLVGEEYISKKGSGTAPTFYWIESKNRAMGQPKGSQGPPGGVPKKKKPKAAGAPAGAPAAAPAAAQVAAEDEEDDEQAPVPLSCICLGCKAVWNEQLNQNVVTAWTGCDECDRYFCQTCAPGGHGLFDEHVNDTKHVQNVNAVGEKRKPSRSQGTVTEATKRARALIGVPEAFHAALAQQGVYLVNGRVVRDLQDVERVTHEVENHMVHASTRGRSGTGLGMYNFTLIKGACFECSACKTPQSLPPAWTREMATTANLTCSNVGKTCAAAGAAAAAPAAAAPAPAPAPAPAAPVGRKQGGGKLGSEKTQQSMIDRLSMKQEILNLLNVSAETFKKHFATDSSGKIRDKVCSTFFEPNHMEEHVKTKKHVNAVQSVKSKTVSDTRIEKFLRDNGAVGGYTALTTKTFRLKVVRKWLSMNLPMNALNKFADFLFQETQHERLPDRSHLSRDYIPIAHDMAITDLMEELRGKPVHIIFDGTTNECENFAFGARFHTTVKSETSMGTRTYPVQRLLRICRYNASLNADEVIASFINTVTSPCLNAEEKVAQSSRGGFGIGRYLVVGVGHDCASVNLKALGSSDTSYLLPSMLPCYVDVHCVSHTATNTAAKVEGNCVEALIFWQTLSGVFSRSTKAKASFKLFTKRRWISWSKTRWFGQRDAMEQAYAILPLIVEWVEQAVTSGEFEDSAETSNFNKLRALAVETQWPRPVNGPAYKLCQTQWLFVRLEFALLLEATKSLRRLTYMAEGDYSAAFTVYDEILAVKEDLDSKYIQPDTYPAVSDVLTEWLRLTPEGQPRAEKRQELITYMKQRLQPLSQYFYSHFWDDEARSRKNVTMYEFARIANPAFVHQKGEGFDVAFLADKLDFLQDGMRSTTPSGPRDDVLIGATHDQTRFWRADRANLLRELPAYKTYCTNFDVATYHTLQYKEKCRMLDEFWSYEYADFPTWTLLARNFQLLQPSSAFVERIFSHLKRVLDRPGMEGAKVDLIESTIMLIVNGSDVGVDWAD